MTTTPERIVWREPIYCRDCAFHFRGECPEGWPPSDRSPVRDEVSAAHDHDCTALNETLGASPLAEPWNEGERT